MIFDVENVQNWHFLTKCQQMETQILVISFDFSWFLAKDLAFWTQTACKSKYSLRFMTNSHEMIRWTLLLFQSVFKLIHHQCGINIGFWVSVEKIVDKIRWAAVKEKREII